MANAALSKRVVVVTMDGEARDYEVLPGTTAADLIQATGTNPDNVWLANNDGIPFGPNDAVYPNIRADGETRFTLVPDATVSRP